jgi:CheY-like chemotaxis protein
MLKVLGMMLTESGFQVMSGRSVQEGLTLLHQSRRLPDIIISDMVMPSENGMTFLEHIRDTPELASIPFILMSAHSSTEMQQQAFQMGADAFLTKPFQFETLHSTIRNLGLRTPAKV